MFTYWPDTRDDNWSWMLLRPIAEGIYGGGEFNEIHRIARRIRPGETDDWYAEFRKTAEQVEAWAEEARQRGHGVTAEGHYLRAANYYRWAEFLLRPDDPRRVPTYERCVACFRCAGEYFDPPLEVVQVPYEDTTLEGYFIRAKPSPDLAPDGRGPVLLYVAGADVIKEALYFLGGRAAVQRGLHLLVVDGPGQGAALRFKNLVARPDTERSIGAVLDYAGQRPEIDPGRIGALGRAIGGYYVARAAAFDQRLRACVMFTAVYDALDCYDFSPPIRWQFQWLTGAQDSEDARQRLRAFNLAGVAERITCPMLIVHGASSYFAPPWHAERLFREVQGDKQLHLYPPGEPGSIHMQYDVFPHTIPLITDWLVDYLKPGR